MRIALLENELQRDKIYTSSEFSSYDRKGVIIFKFGGDLSSKVNSYLNIEGSFNENGSCASSVGPYYEATIEEANKLKKFLKEELPSIYEVW